MLRGDGDWSVPVFLPPTMLPTQKDHVFTITVPSLSAGDIIAKTYRVSLHEGEEGIKHIIITEEITPQIWVVNELHQDISIGQGMDDGKLTRHFTNYFNMCKTNMRIQYF